MSRARSLPAACLLALLAWNAPAQAQSMPDPEEPDFGLIDAGNSLLGGRAEDPYEAIRRLPLNGDGSWYVTFGGQIRERVETSHNPDFGLSEPADNTYLLHRIMLSADLHLGQSFRAFVQLVNALAPGWNGPKPATQEDQLDLLQAFAELTLPLGEDAVMLRAGRQEMSYGSSRLVSVRESPNVRRAFDGFRGAWIGTDLRIDTFLVRPVTPALGLFNDSSNLDQAFWGVYATTPVDALPGLNVDLYYLGLNREDATFAQGTATENRQTFGTRLFGERGGFDWDVEAALQVGSFGDASIFAWTVSLAGGYTFRDLPFTPRLGLNADAISGDRDLDDGRLGTFNPLYPKLPYFSEANLVAPANLLDLQPNVTLWPVPEVGVNLAWNPLWKETKADAFYAPPLSPVEGTADSSGRFIGHQVSGSVEWAVTRNLTLAGTYVHYMPGQVVKAAGGSAGDFAAIWVKLDF